MYLNPNYDDMIKYSLPILSNYLLSLININLFIDIYLNICDYLKKFANITSTISNNAVISSLHPQNL